MPRLRQRSEPANRQRMSGGLRPFVRGVTMVEVVVVIAIAAILAGLAAPSFESLIARKRLEGVASELTTDLQYARSEAVQRQQVVRVSSGSASTCYVVHTFPGAGSCDCSSTPICSGGASELKVVQFTGGTSLTASNTVEFDPVRGMSTAAGVFIVGTTQGVWRLHSELTPLGRVRTCSPSGLLAGYPPC